MKFAPLEQPEMVPTGRVAVAVFMRDFMRAPPDADIAISLGQAANEPDVVVIIVRITHPKMKTRVCGFTPQQAEFTADFLEESSKKYPVIADECANMIMALRAAAEKARAVDLT